MQDLYVNNKDFKGYVERYSADHRITAEKAMEHALVRQYAEMLRRSAYNGGKEKSTHTPIGECV